MPTYSIAPATLMPIDIKNIVDYVTANLNVDGLSRLRPPSDGTVSAPPRWLAKIALSAPKISHIIIKNTQTATGHRFP